ncbi:MAG: hypothetical protein AB7N80_14070 [Bdellovibrionales bacterium]
MKKFLAVLAVAALSANAFGGEREGYKATDDMKDAGKNIEKSYKQVANPMRPVAGLVTLPLGRTVYYTGEAIEILGKAGVESAIKNVESTGACLKDSHGLGNNSACVVEFPGKLTVTVVNVTGYSVANVMDAVGGVATAPFQIAAEASADLSAWLEKNNVPLAPQVARAFSIVFDKGGQIVGVTVTTLSGGVREAADGIAMTVTEVFNIPASALRGDLKGAGRSALIGLGRGMCTVIDGTLILGVRLVAGIVGVFSGKAAPVQGCNQGFDEDAKAIRNGTFVPRAPADDMYHGG